jgi:CBS-domain-containing membrane protein
LAIGFVAWLADAVEIPLLLGSLGASCVMLFGFPDLPFSQPRHVVVGHLVSSLSGLLALTLLGPQWWSLAIALALALALMMVLGVVHPPAGSNPVIVFLSQPAWTFAFYPTLLGAVVVVLIALLYNNVTRATNYPKYW